MREHCARGYHMLRKIPFLAGAAEIVFCHQEHYDGNGYPNGLRGREIPIGARIFAVADTLDAITSDRPYRKARGFDAAREEILRCSGTQFDPAVVEVFLKIPNELWQELRSEISGQNKRFSTFDMTQSTAGALPSLRFDLVNSSPGGRTMPPLIFEQRRNRVWAALPGWQIEAGDLVRTFQFKDFRRRARIRQPGRRARRSRRATTPTSISATTACAWPWSPTTPAASRRKDFDLAAKTQTLP